MSVQITFAYEMASSPAEAEARFHELIANAKPSTGPYRVEMMTDDRKAHWFRVVTDSDSAAMAAWRNGDADRGGYGGVTIAEFSQKYNVSGPKYGPSVILDLEEAGATALFVAIACNNFHPLLKALRTLVDVVEVGLARKGFNDDQPEMIAARAAIAEALGIEAP